MIKVIGQSSEMTAKNSLQIQVMPDPAFKKIGVSDKKKLNDNLKAAPCSAQPIAKSIKRLAELFMPTTGEEGLQRIIEYCNRILSSRLQLTIEADEMHLVTLIQKKCILKLIQYLKVVIRKKRFGLQVYIRN